MFYNPLFNYSQQVPPNSLLPNIHPETLDCIIRSELPHKGSLYVSNLEAAENPETLKKLKVSAVLTCAEGYRLDHPEHLVPNYKYFPLSDNTIFDLNEYFSSTTEFIKQALSKSNCIVHCLTGENKSIAVIIAFLINNYAMTFDDALAYASRKRKLVNLDERYVKALQSFAKSLEDKNFTKSNQIKSITIPYKTQNSRFENYENSSRIFSTNISKNNKAKISEGTKIHFQQFKDTVTFTKKKKVQIDPSNRSFQNNDSRLLSESPEINSILNNKEILNHSKNPIEIEKNKTQATKVKTQKRSRFRSFSVDHKEALQFDTIFSSNHQNYIGVKREYKNSRTSFKKQQGSVINFSSNSQELNLLEFEGKKIDLLQVSKELKNSRFSERNSMMNENTHQLTKRSEQKSQANSKIVQKNSRINTKLAQFNHMNSSSLRILNPESENAYASDLNVEEKSSMRIKSRKSVQSLNSSEIQSQKSHIQTESEQLELSKILSAPFKGKESKKDYFQSLNEELNSNLDLISTSYETKIADLRINYQNRLRHLKKPEKSKKSTECGGPISPLS